MTAETARLLAKALGGHMIAERSLAKLQEADDPVLVEAANIYMESLRQVGAVLKAVRS